MWNRRAIHGMLINSIIIIIIIIIHCTAFYKDNS